MPRRCPPGAASARSSWPRWELAAAWCTAPGQRSPGWRPAECLSPERSPGGPWLQPTCFSHLTSPTSRWEGKEWVILWCYLRIFFQFLVNCVSPFNKFHQCWWWPYLNAQHNRKRQLCTFCGWAKICQQSSHHQICQMFPRNPVWQQSDLQLASLQKSPTKTDLLTETL